MKTVLTEHRYVEDVRDEFYFNTPQGGYGIPLPQIGEPVAIVSEVTGNLLAIGVIEKQGEPYAECSTVKVTQRLT